MARRRPSGSDRYELALELPVRRGTACVNIRWDDKELFDLIQARASYERGRLLSQWEVFSLVLASALENGESDAARLAAPIAARRGRPGHPR